MISLKYLASFNNLLNYVELVEQLNLRIFGRAT